MKRERVHTVTKVDYICDGCSTDDVWWITPATHFDKEQHWCDSCARRRLVESGEFEQADAIDNLADWYKLARHA